MPSSTALAALSSRGPEPVRGRQDGRCPPTPAALIRATDRLPTIMPTCLILLIAEHRLRAQRRFRKSLADAERHEHAGSNHLHHLPSASIVPVRLRYRHRGLFNTVISFAF